MLISNTVQGLLHVAVPALVTRTPLVVYVRDLGRGGNRPPLEVWVYESLMRLWSSGVIFNSETTRRSWRVSAPSIVVPTAIEDRFFTASAPARHGGIVMVGRIARWKGQAEVIRALNHLADGGRSVELTLVGDRTFGDNVDLPPARFPLTLKGFADPLEYLTHRQLLVHASKTPEPFGQVLAQAAAAGIPIICANRGGQTEWLKHGESCLMSDPHDTDALAAAIEQTLDDPARSAQRADVANAASEQFRAEKAYGPLQDWLKKVANL
ncbi:glycosyltransferase family 4 protein [Microbacterium sp. Gd 4-13]|uniref:glycosyltransferase family 4 protein n=1 Tax=Microbacterium sp. Gd 4-13 TaxID=2173179 RepID=UPI001402F0AC|nr:glycosyltransferase family 4 protein [Microbacterium sp. Gd 4-13]